jgi:hypothetical protein
VKRYGDIVELMIESSKTPVKQHLPVRRLLVGQ